jgi:hypothetical protein
VLDLLAAGAPSPAPLRGAKEVRGQAPSPAPLRGAKEVRGQARHDPSKLARALLAIARAR